MKIAIFPGHVGKDPGAVDKVQEQELDTLMSIEAVINGQVAVLLKHCLDKEGVDCAIHIGSFENRLKESLGASFGISLHCDSCTDNKAHGFTVFHHPTSATGQLMAGQLHRELLDSLQGTILSRGVQSHPHYVMLFKTKFPCLLLEMGFLSNPADEKQLNCYETQMKIVDGILNFTDNLN